MTCAGRESGCHMSYRGAGPRSLLHLQHAFRPETGILQRGWAWATRRRQLTRSIPSIDRHACPLPSLTGLSARRRFAALGRSTFLTGRCFGAGRQPETHVPCPTHRSHTTTCCWCMKRDISPLPMLIPHMCISCPWSPPRPTNPGSPGPPRHSQSSTCPSSEQLLRLAGIPLEHWALSTRPACGDTAPGTSRRDDAGVMNDPAKSALPACRADTRWVGGGVEGARRARGNDP